MYIRMMTAAALAVAVAFAKSGPHMCNSSYVHVYIRRRTGHVGSLDAGPRVAAILSVVETCRWLDIPVREYLRDVLRGGGSEGFRGGGAYAHGVETPSFRLTWVGGSGQGWGWPNAYRQRCRDARPPSSCSSHADQFRRAKPRLAEIGDGSSPASSAVIREPRSRPHATGFHFRIQRPAFESPAQFAVPCVFPSPQAIKFAGATEPGGCSNAYHQAPKCGPAEGVSTRCIGGKLSRSSSHLPNGRILCSSSRRFIPSLIWHFRIAMHTQQSFPGSMLSNLWVMESGTGRLLAESLTDSPKAIGPLNWSKGQSNTGTSFAAGARPSLARSYLLLV